MSTFSADPASFSVHAKYVSLLKAGLKKVTKVPTTKFLYFKTYKFGPSKKGPLLVADYDAQLPHAFAQVNLKPQADGVVSLTPEGELEFTVRHGKVERKFLKRYLAGVSKSIRPVFVTDADEDDLDTKIEVEPDSELGEDESGEGTESPAQNGPKRKALPKLPVPPEVIRRFKELSVTALQPEWETQKHDTLDKALQLYQTGHADDGKRLLDALATKALPPKAAVPKVPPKPLPKPDPEKVAAMVKARNEIRAELAELVQEGGDSSDEESQEDAEDESRSEEGFDAARVKRAALSHASSIASAQQRLLDEEKAFADRKTAKKSDKIKVSTSQQTLATEQAQAKEDKAIEKAKAEFVKKREREGESTLQTLKRKVGLGEKDEKAEQAAAEEKAEKDRIEKAQALKKAQDEIDKFTKKPLGGVKLAAVAEKGLATGIHDTLALDNSDIAQAAGSLATNAASTASNMATAVSEFYAFSKTTGAERSVHLKKAMEALGSSFGGLVNITKSSLTITEHAGAMEATSAVPILGIVTAVPALMSEINHLRSAMTRLVKQEKVHAQLHAEIKAGDATQQTLHDLTGNFIARDTESIAKDLAKVLLDFTKIAGHGVTLGGITGPIGAALIGVASAGKVTLAAVSKVQNLVGANKANDRRKKLNPTLNASSDWQGLRKVEPDAKENVELTQALQVLDKVARGTKAHAEALDSVVTKAKAAGTKNARLPDVVQFTSGLATLAQQEKERWKSGAEPIDEGDEDEDEAQPGAEDPHQRNARKLAKHDPRMAAQMLIDQAQREGSAGGPAFKVLKSFGIKASQVFAEGESDDDKLASNREMRQKVLYKLGADDKTAQTMTQGMGSAKDTVAGYLDMRKKGKELDNYLLAKNKLQHGGQKKRGPGWKLKMQLVSDDIEEKKEALLEQVEYLVSQGDIDAGTADEVRLLLKRTEKAANEPTAA